MYSLIYLQLIWTSAAKLTSEFSGIKIEDYQLDSDNYHWQNSDMLMSKSMGFKKNRHVSPLNHFQDSEEMNSLISYEPSPQKEVQDKFLSSYNQSPYM